jgi:hypothetical protein
VHRIATSTGAVERPGRQARAVARAGGRRPVATTGAHGCGAASGTLPATEAGARAPAEIVS